MAFAAAQKPRLVGRIYVGASYITRPMVKARRILSSCWTMGASVRLNTRDSFRLFTDISLLWYVIDVEAINLLAIVRVATGTRGE